MTKDDYGVIVFRVLVYLYSCLKRVTVFDYWEFDLATQKEKLKEEYFIDMINMMNTEEYITGFKSIKAWELLKDPKKKKILTKLNGY